MTEVMDPPVAGAMGALAGLDAALDAVAAVPLWQLGEAELLEFRRLSGVLADRLSGFLLAATGEISVRGSTAAVAAVPTTTWLAQALGQHPGAAAREVRLAGALRADLPATAAALAAGSIPVAAAEVIAESDRAMARTATAAERVDAEALLAAHAPALGVRGLQRAALHLRHRLDPDHGDRVAAEERDQTERRELHLALAADGSSTGRFVLDKEATAVLRTALDPLTAPRPDPRAGGPAGGDRRWAPRRRADALVALAEQALRRGDLPDSGGVPAQLTVTVDLATLQRATGAPAAEIDFGLPLSAEAARRLGCDARVLPVVLGGPSQPLDVGRAARTVPVPMRRALVVRDGGCAFPDCDRPPSWTDAHHIRHWADGGDTALDNLVLLCRSHHRTVHHHGWQVRIRADRLPEFTPPAWIDPNQTPRRHIRHTPTARGDP